MEDHLLASRPRITSDAPPLVSPTLVGLYILLLAFFILLGTISQRSEGRMRAVIDGINVTFKREAAAAFGDAVLGEPEGESVPADFLAEVGRLTATALPLARIDQPHGGRRLEAVVAVDALFEPEGATLHPAGARLIAQIAAAIAARPAGHRYDAEFVAGRGADDAARRVAVLRASTIAEALVAAGAPRDSISIGLARGDGATAAFRFHIRPANEERVDFRGTPAKAGS